MPGYRTEVLQEQINDDDGREEEEREGKKEKEKRMHETDQETVETKSIKSNERLNKEMERDMERCQDNAKESSGNADTWNAFDITKANLSKLRNQINKVKEQYHNKLTTKCYQLKLHRRMVDDFKFIRNIHENETIQPVLDKIMLIDDQWRTLNLWEILQSVNPNPIMEFGEDEPLKQELISLENKEDMIWRWSIVLCEIFAIRMQTLGWKVGDTLDIEGDICEVVGQLLMKVEKQARSSLLDCMQNAMMNIQVENSEQDVGKIRTLLITKKKYNVLNLACILLEQMIIDIKDNNVSWSRTVCAQFIDLVVQLSIEPGYQTEVLLTLTHLLKLESEWKVADVYNLTKTGLLRFLGDQTEFHRYLLIIRNFALHPSLNICQTEDQTPVELKEILYGHDKNIWRCLDEVVCGKETEKSVDQVLEELKEDEVGQVEKDNIQLIITNSQMMLNKYKYVPGYLVVIERELDRIRKSKPKYEVDVLSSCLIVTSLALFLCRGYWPLNTQLVSYCLLVIQRTNEKGRLLEILTGEGKSCVIAMVAATYALLEKNRGYCNKFACAQST